MLSTCVVHVFSMQLSCVTIEVSRHHALFVLSPWSWFLHAWYTSRFLGSFMANLRVRFQVVPGSWVFVASRGALLVLFSPSSFEDIYSRYSGLNVKKCHFETYRNVCSFAETFSFSLLSYSIT